MTLLCVGVLAALAFSGCLDPIGVPDRSLSLIEATEHARPVVEGIDRQAHLIGFVAQETAPPSFLGPLLGGYVLPDRVILDGAPADGRVPAWSLVYGTPGGQVIHVAVRAGAPAATVESVSGTVDPVIQHLWALNLGGRLLVDTPEAMSAWQRADPDAAAQIDAGASAVYASSVVAVDGLGQVFDMVHEIYLTDPSAASYTRYGQLRHDDAVLVDAGDTKPEAKGQRLVLVDERFAVSPFTPRLQAAKDLSATVRDVTMRLDVEGLGTYMVRISSPQVEVVAVEGQALGQPESIRRDLGTLIPGTYLLEAEGTGSVSFRLVLEGLVGI